MLGQCPIIHIQPSEFWKLCFWEYEALLEGYNCQFEDKEKIEPPSIEEFQHMLSLDQSK